MNKGSTTLHNGTVMPMLGYHIDTTFHNIYANLVTALRAGYRMFDIPAIGDIEKEFAKAVESTGIARNELFIITHIVTNSETFDRAVHRYRNSLSRLKTDYSDALIVDISDICNREEDIRQHWKAAETAYKNGVARTIGIATENPADIESILVNCEIAPMINQAIFYPGRPNTELMFSCDEHRITLQEYLPLRYEAVLKSKEISIFAEKYHVEPIEIILIFLMQNGCPALVSQMNESSLKHILDQEPFILSSDDMKYLEVMKDYGAK